MRFFILSLSLLLPISIFAQNGMLDSQTTLAQMSLLVAQYESRIKQLESENSILRNEMTKANIKIPLADYSGAIAQPLPTMASGQSSTIPATLSGTSSSWEASISANSLAQITARYGAQSAGFISRINKEWSAIKSAYSFSDNAHLAGYEFVQTGAQDFVFTDITVGTGARTGVYDIKILYQFDKTDYKRKLIGIFNYSSTTGRYITRTWSNPFSGIARTFIIDPYYIGNAAVPFMAISSSWSSSNTSLPSTLVPVNSGSIVASNSVTLADINKAYSDKRYLTTISLSNTYLASNAPTSEVISIRYRTYFIIGKYTESLAELAKMESLGALDRQTACNAQVIATYSKNQTLVDKYTAICKK